VFAEAVAEVAATCRADVVLPLGDYPTLAAAAHRETISARAALPVAASSAIALAHDKLDILELARSIGIDAPHAEPVARDATATPSDRIGFPCVLKLRRGCGGRALRFIESLDQLRQAVTALPNRGDDLIDYRQPIVQELVPGEVHDVCALFNRGQPRALLSQRRVRMWPPRGGVGIEVETTDDPELREQAAALLGALSWHGPAQVEFKRDARDGRPRLLEVNPRFWGTLDLAIHAGIDFPTLACRMAVDGDVAPRAEYRVGLRFRWPLPWNLRAVVLRPGLRSIAAMWPLAPGLRTDLRITDPLPHVAATGWIIADALRRMRRSKGR
jgi:predicted ATP-grasp superfamily ATP-dependent carboligase